MTQPHARPLAIETATGLHLVVEFSDCDVQAIATVERVKPALERAVKESEFSPVHWAYHQCEPEGMSASVLITESHLNLHTWPDRALVCADVFTCGDAAKAARAVQVLADAFGAKRTVVSRFPRGVPAEPA